MKTNYLKRFDYCNLGKKTAVNLKQFLMDVKAKYKKLSSFRSAFQKCKPSVFKSIIAISMMLFTEYFGFFGKDKYFQWKNYLYCRH